MDTVAGSWRWWHSDFVKLWGAQTLAQIGSQIAFLALPLTAILVLDATPLELGLLTALADLPTLLLGLHAGAIVDRHRRRPILVWTSAGRALILTTIPVAWVAGVLSVELLFAVVLLAGMLTLFFDIAYQALLPDVVSRSRLVEANSRLELSRTAAEVVGPGVAGWLVQAATAPLALLANALTFVASALLLARLRVIETIEAQPAAGRRIFTEIGDGLRVVFADPRLRAIAGSRAVLGLFNSMLEAVFVLFVARALGLGPAIIGLVFAIGSVGFVIGSMLPGRLTTWIGVGPATIAAIALVAVSDLLVAVAPGSVPIAVVLLSVAQFCFGVGFTVFNVNQASVRQLVVPGRLLGRAGATLHLLAFGLAPVGALLGGVLAELIGLRLTLAVAAVGELGAAVWLWYSPIRAMMDLPRHVDNDIEHGATSQASGE